MFSEDAKEQFRETTVPLVKMLHKIDGVDGYAAFDMDREESDGTQRLFELAGPFIHVLHTGSVLVVDELSRHLHPLLSRFLMSLFTNKDINKKDAQLICTTHDATLINLKHLRRDQIWFVEKDKIQASKLKPLSDYSPRKGEAIEKGYLAGRYGAIPIFDEYSEI